MAGVSKGAVGEVAAARFLREKGFRILSSNYRCRQGEVDIIAAIGQYIVFVEVKTRGQNAMYSPREAVTLAKQRRLIQTALIYLSKYPTDLQPRFDVVEVVTAAESAYKIVEINHIMGAYEAGDLSRAF